MTNGCGFKKYFDQGVKVCIELPLKIVKGILNFMSLDGICLYNFVVLNGKYLSILMTMGKD